MKAPSSSSPRGLNYLQPLIQSATGAALADWALIENIMRDEIFHSLLDWQSEAQLAGAARQAAACLNADRDLYEFARSSALATFEQMHSSIPTRSP